MPCAIEMLVRIFVTAYREVEEAKIVFDTSEIANVSRLLEVDTSGRIFNQCTIEIVFLVFGSSQLHEDKSILDMKAPFKTLIFTSFHKRSRSVAITQCLFE